MLLAAVKGTTSVTRAGDTPSESAARRRRRCPGPRPSHPSAGNTSTSPATTPGATVPGAEQANSGRYDGGRGPLRGKVALGINMTRVGAAFPYRDGKFALFSLSSHPNVRRRCIGPDTACFTALTCGNVSSSEVYGERTLLFGDRGRLSANFPRSGPRPPSPCRARKRSVPSGCRWWPRGPVPPRRRPPPPLRRPSSAPLRRTGWRRGSS